VIPVDGHQLSHNINGEQDPSARDGAQVSDDRDGSTLILPFGFPRAGHPARGISHVMIIVNHIDDNLIDPALRNKVARVLRGPP